ncbi:MAG: ATP-binding cassette domain-containing protein [Bacteroidetes bacterium]|nr:ATP-binding cassette domain-containing protein [Bacteroidota bacterium]
MNESILKALMQLFALVADADEEGVSTRERAIVEAYLKNQLSAGLVMQYINLFDEYIAFHHRGIKKKDSIKARKRASVNALKVLQICEQINEELQQNQKVVVMVQLLEFVSHGQITEKELDFVNTVASGFNIPDNEYENGKSLILEDYTTIPQSDRVLVINKLKDFSHKQVKHIYSESLEGAITVLHFPSTNMYFFRYAGDETFYLNSQAIVPGRTYVFETGSSIRSSKTNTIYYSNVAAKYLDAEHKAKIVFTAKEVEFRFKNSSNGIQRFNFSEESGNLVGIMGGSGVGKSTLLNVLNGNLKPQSGQILINGYDVHADTRQLEGMIGFVPQDDLLIEELTVYQNLYYNARLCFSNFSKSQINDAVKRVLEDLDLWEIRNLTVGNSLNKFISGGQRKRLNIALELIREPAVLFVDEPTSGLSSMDSEMVMDLLKELTLKGKLIIVNIHQPSSDIYKMFDKLLVLDKGGYLIYAGNPIEAVVYFKTQSNHINSDESECPACGNVNPEQVLQIIEAKVVNEYGKLTRSRKVSSVEWNSTYRENIESKLNLHESKGELPASHFKIPNFFRQFQIFAIRDVLAKLTNRQYLLLTFLEAPALAIIIGFFTKYISGTPDDPSAFIFSENENLPQYIFMAVVVSLFLGLTVSAEEIIKDRRILQRESFLNLSRTSYLNSKVLIQFAISAIQALTFVLIANWIMGIKGMTLYYWFMLFTTSCFANMLGLNISAGLNSVVTIYILIPLILVPQLLFSGVIVKFDKLHQSITSYKYVPIIGDIMTSRWAYEGLAVNQFKKNRFQRNFFEVEKEMSYNAFRYNLLIPELRTKLYECQKNIKNQEEAKKVEKDLRILHHEVAILMNLPENKPAKFAQLDNLSPEKFSVETAQATFEYLDGLKKFYIDKYNDASARKDKLYNKLVKKFKTKEEVDKLKDTYHNKSLSDLVLNKTEIKRHIETDDRLIQKYEPVYMEPEGNYGRAHFYAPVKKIGSLRIDTFWFNAMVIWLTSLFMYVTLCFDTLKKLLSQSGKIKFSKYSAEKKDKTKKHEKVDKADINA